MALVVDALAGIGVYAISNCSWQHVCEQADAVVGDLQRIVEKHLLGHGAVLRDLYQLQLATQLAYTY